ncbi:MAG: hypothetical protein SOH81_07955 [Acetobacter sp.]|jgi:hypothetical protein
MSDLDITSANSVFVITVTSLLQAPVTLENYAADRAWDAPELEMAETEMSVDGYMNAGWVPNPVDQTISFSAASSSVPVFEAIMAAQQTARSLYRLAGEITHQHGPEIHHDQRSSPPRHGAAGRRPRS